MVKAKYEMQEDELTALRDIIWKCTDSGIDCLPMRMGGVSRPVWNQFHTFVDLQRPFPRPDTDSVSVDDLHPVCIRGFLNANWKQQSAPVTARDDWFHMWLRTYLLLWKAYKTDERTLPPDQDGEALVSCIKQLQGTITLNNSELNAKDNEITHLHLVQGQLQAEIGQLKAEVERLTVQNLDKMLFTAEEAAQWLMESSETEACNV